MNGRSELPLPTGALGAVVYLSTKASPPTPEVREALSLALSDLFGPAVADPEGGSDQAPDQLWRFADRWWQVPS